MKLCGFRFALYFFLLTAGAAPWRWRHSTRPSRRNIYFGMGRLGAIDPERSGMIVAGWLPQPVGGLKVLAARVCWQAESCIAIVGRKRLRIPVRPRVRHEFPGRLSVDMPIVNTEFIVRDVKLQRESPGRHRPSIVGDPKIVQIGVVMTLIVSGRRTRPVGFDAETGFPAPCVPRVPMP